MRSFCDDGLVDLAGGDSWRLRQLFVDEALVVAEVEVGLGAVGGDEDLAVLIRRHRARVDVEVRVELLEGDGDVRDLRMRPRAAVVMPLPTELTTPPVTKMYFGICSRRGQGSATKEMTAPPGDAARQES